jgi:V/A-type H+-transporting ATPase subunit I
MAPWQRRVGAAVLRIGLVCARLNSLLAKQWGRRRFDHNGLAGLIFYWSLIGMGIKAFKPDLPLNMVVLIGLAVVSGLGLTFSELFGRLVEKERPLIKGDTITYLLQAFFELFETVISLLSNTLSYVRMGAFAVAHGAISMVVFIMAESISPQHGLGYWFVLAVGNLFVIGFEGMIVGIQTMRLEYYEFFSKFFTGGGEPYVPFNLLSREKV